MRPVTRHLDVLWQIVVPLVAVRMQPARENLGESLSVLRHPVGLVLVQDDGILSATAVSRQGQAATEAIGSGALTLHIPPERWLLFPGCLRQ